MKFEIINPSDPYTMEADDLQIAAVAVCLLGEGKYMAKGIGTGDGHEVPFFIFGGVDEWFTEKFGMDYGEIVMHTLNNRNDALARAFESVTLGRTERSSLNDIGGRAQAIAKAIREKAAALAQGQGGSNA